jgi:hypothetical protein
VSRRDEVAALAFGHPRPEPEPTEPALTEDRVREIFREEIDAARDRAKAVNSDG